MGYALCVILGTILGIGTIAVVTRNEAEEQLEQAYQEGYMDGCNKHDTSEHSDDL